MEVVYAHCVHHSLGHNEIIQCVKLTNVDLTKSSMLQDYVLLAKLVTLQTQTVENVFQKMVNQ